MLPALKVAPNARARKQDAAIESGISLSVHGDMESIETDLCLHRSSSPPSSTAIVFTCRRGEK
eukprot:2394071-Prorocentrum_lima.AAC.1